MRLKIKVILLTLLMAIVTATPPLTADADDTLSPPPETLRNQIQYVLPEGTEKDATLAIPEKVSKGYVSAMGYGFGKGMVFTLYAMAESEGAAYVLGWFLLFPNSDPGQAFVNLLLTGGAVGALFTTSGAISMKDLEKAVQHHAEELGRFSGQVSDEMLNAAGFYRDHGMPQVFSSTSAAGKQQTRTGRDKSAVVLLAEVESATLEKIYARDPKTHPELRYRITMNVRLLDRNTKTVLFKTRVGYSGGAETLRGWLEKNGKRLTEELQKARTALAYNIIEELFLVYAPNDSTTY